MMPVRQRLAILARREILSALIARCFDDSVYSEVTQM